MHRPSAPFVLASGLIVFSAWGCFPTPAYQSAQALPGGRYEMHAGGQLLGPIGGLSTSIEAGARMGLGRRWDLGFNVDLIHSQFAGWLVAPTLDLKKQFYAGHRWDWAFGFGVSENSFGNALLPSLHLAAYTDFHLARSLWYARPEVLVSGVAQAVGAAVGWEKPLGSFRLRIEGDYYAGTFGPTLMLGAGLGWSADPTTLPETDGP